MYCKNCGEEFKSANTIFCTNCNTRVGDGTKFCSECGEPIRSNIQSNCSKCGVMLNLTKKEEQSESKSDSTVNNGTFQENNNETFQSNTNPKGYNNETYQQNTNPKEYTNQIYNQTINQTFNQNTSQGYNDSSYARDNSTKYRDELIGKPKSKVAAILLALFLGGFGVHRYYIRRPASATVMLVLSLIGVATLGFLNACVGIWIIVDMFLMGFNNLKPKNGYFK